MTEKYYEMLWDCAACGAKGLFAKSQKHCPLCGSVQDPEKRYFPEEGQEVEVQGHRYVGADWHCGYCQSPNAAAALFCANCGAPKEGNKEVRLKQELPAEEAAPQPVQAKASSGFPLFKIVLVLLIVGAGFFLARFLWKTEETVKVAALNWSREIDIERYAAVDESQWCKDLPNGAYSIRRTQEESGKKKIPDGETCKDIKTDKGDGTFTKKHECTPKFREVPQMADKCHFRINRWKVVRAEKAQGAQGTPPAWPSPRLFMANTIFANAMGNERLGGRREAFSVQVQAKNGELLSCSLDAAVWSGLKVGEAVSVKRRASGGVDCSEIVRR